MDTQPLVEALRDLTTAHEQCIAGTEDLIEALVAADVPRMRAAVITHAALLRSIDQAELRRRLAVRGLSYTLTGGGPMAERLTFTALLRALAPEDAAPLVEARRQLLAVVLRLQVLQRRAMTLAQTGQTVTRRTIRAALGEQSGAYGPTGGRALPAHLPAVRPGRWA